MPLQVGLHDQDARPLTSCKVARMRNDPPRALRIVPLRGAAAGAAAGRITDAGRPGTARENFATNQPQRIENRQQSLQNRQQRRDEIRNQYEQNNPGNFWEENPGWTAWAITRPFAWATWGSVGSWCGYSGEPTAYSYGENVYYADEQVYVNDQPVATTDEYAEQAEVIAAAAPSAPTEKPNGYL